MEGRNDSWRPRASTRARPHGYLSPFQNEEHKHHRVLAFSYLALMATSRWVELIFCFLAISTSHFPKNNYHAHTRPHHSQSLSNPSYTNRDWQTAATSAHAALSWAADPVFPCRSQVDGSGLCSVSAVPPPTTAFLELTKPLRTAASPQNWGGLKSEKRSQKNKT